MKNMLIIMALFAIMSCKKESVQTPTKPEQPKYIRVVSVSVDGKRDYSPIVIVPEQR